MLKNLTKRAFELEGEVVRLQHDLGSALNSGDEASREVERLTREIDELKKKKSALFEKVSEQAEELKRLDSDSRSKIIYLEKQIEALNEAKKAVSLSEETAKARLVELEREIGQVKEEKIAIQGLMESQSDRLESSEIKVIDMYKTMQKLNEIVDSNEKTIQKLAKQTHEMVEKDGFSVSILMDGAVSADFLKDFHRRRVKVLAEAGADLIAFETTPNKLETQAYARCYGGRQYRVCSSVWRSC